MARSAATEESGTDANQSATCRGAVEERVGLGLAPPVLGGRRQQVAVGAGLAHPAVELANEGQRGHLEHAEPAGGEARVVDLQARRHVEDLAADVEHVLEVLDAPAPRASASRQRRTQPRPRCPPQAPWQT